MIARLFRAAQAQILLMQIAVAADDVAEIDELDRALPDIRRDALNNLLTLERRRNQIVSA